MKARRVAREASAMTKFYLLMWKNFLQQWRHRVQSVLEVILPVGTLALVLVLRGQIEPTMRNMTAFPPLQADGLYYSSQVLLGMNLSDLSIAYSPENPVLEDVVETAIQKLLLKNMNELISLIPDSPPSGITIPPDWNLNFTLPDWDFNITLPDANSTFVEDLVASLITVRPYNRSDDLRSIYSLEASTRSIIAAVEFDDSLADITNQLQLPLDIAYSLRFPERPRLYSLFGQGSMSWRSDLLFPMLELPGPRSPTSYEGGNDPGYVNEMFIALQHSISCELISRLTNDAVCDDFEVNLQRFPHPAYFEDIATQVLTILLPMFLLLSFSYTAVNIIRAVTTEKELQLKETMKIMGLPTWLHWTAWFCKQFIYLVVMSVIIVILLKVKWFTSEEGFSDYSVFTNTPWSVLFVFLNLYFACTIFFCFMISGFFSKAGTAALFGAVAWLLTYVPAFILALDISVPVGVQVFTCFFINSAMGLGLQLLMAKETAGGMQWGEFFTSPDSSSGLLFGHVIIILVADCVLYMLVALYLEQVLPGPYGAAKPWNFIFTKEFWCRSKVADDSIYYIDEHEPQDVVKEADPTNYPIGVKIANLSKVYGSFVAVNNLSLNIYDDQITVLLGHNGAGKSTTISMLTGNVEITAGSVILSGYDIARQAPEARANLGLCPQHNVLFNELTVREHLVFFARLKGYEGKDLEYEVDSLIQRLELQEKSDYPAGGLSGGQKRRLCVGIALSGGARVVLLDEPTSGMDPASRRALWDLLQKEKKGRSMILTTHFMDEADILGDRIAIMSTGRLQCVGSPFFLKKRFGVGYTLVVVKEENFSINACTNLIQKYIPRISLKEDRGTEVTYNLSNDYSHVFEALLSDLERNKDQVGFKNYGLSATTLEDVFMSVGSDVAPQNHSESDDYPDNFTEDILRVELETASTETLNQEYGLVTGPNLWLQHTLAIWMKLCLVWIRSWPMIVLQVAVPLVQIITTLGVLEYAVSRVPTIQKRELTLADGFFETETLVSFNGTLLGSLGQLAKDAYESIFLNSDTAGMYVTDVPEKSMFDYYLERTTEAADLATERYRILIGATFGDSQVTGWFSNFGYHDVANTLAYIHSALLKSRNPVANISVYNHPIEATYQDSSNTQVLVAMLAMQLAVAIGNSLSIVSPVFIMFYIKERASRAKLLQKSAGIQPAVMWLSAAVFDWLWFMIVCVTIIVACAIFQVEGLSDVDELGRVYLCLMVYGAAMLPLIYILSNFFDGYTTGFVVTFFVHILFGVLAPQIVEALYTPQIDTEHVADILDGIFQFFPLYSLVTAVRLLNSIGLTEYTCLLGCDYLMNLTPTLTECNMDVLCAASPEGSCCVPDNPHFLWDKPGTLRYIVMMIISSCILWAVLMIMEYKLIQRVFNRTKVPPPLDTAMMDQDVKDEIRHVGALGSNTSDFSLVSSGLTKFYGPHLAVDQVSFTVDESECFGLLGVNGAGKTSTFKMMMGDEAISYGDAFVSGHSVKKNINKVHKNIGYCPQFDAVFGELTGRENVRLFSMLRGLKKYQAERMTETLANALGFTKHLDKKVQQYSGGNKRKLSTAVALLGRTKLVFVDEPTTGVDPAAKRQVWRALNAARRAGRALLLTSHSMEECEVLCTRLTIMVNGQFRCLGSPQYLKNKFSQGFTLTIKMKSFDTDATSDSAMIAIKNYIQSSFITPKLMEEYQGLITYYLPDRSMPWFTMFRLMEYCKRELDVEDYTISQTTLEQIFLQFTKYQREGLQ